MEKTESALASRRMRGLVFFPLLDGCLIQIILIQYLAFKLFNILEAKARDKSLAVFPLWYIQPTKEKCS